MSLVCGFQSLVVHLGFPRPSLAVIGVPWVIDGDPPMCLDAQGGIKTKRQPFVVGAVVKSCCLVRGRRDVLS